MNERVAVGPEVEGADLAARAGGGDEFAVPFDFDAAGVAEAQAELVFSAEAAGFAGAEDVPEEDLGALPDADPSHIGGAHDDTDGAGG